MKLKDALKELAKLKSPVKLLFFGKTSDIDRQAIIKQTASTADIINVGSSSSPQKTLSLSDEDENTFILPTVNKSSITDVLTAVITDTRYHARIAAPKGRILLAEDHTESCTLLTDLLKQLGYTDIDKVSDGLELYIKLTDKQCPTYEIIFVSLNISVLDGITAIKRYKQTAGAPSGSLIIAVSETGKLSPEIKSQLYEAGMNGYIVKPISIRDLERLETLRASQVP
jgi:CheY-like chemotaxis protein